MPILSSAVIDDWLSEIFTAAGCPASEARLIAENLVDADASGHPSHGIVRVPRYIDYIASQTVRPACTYEVITQSGNLMLLDGQFSFGQVLGHHLVDEADRLASETGLAMIGLRHAGHLGRIGAWAEYLAEKGYTSIHFVNVAGSRIVAPFGSKEACFRAVGGVIAMVISFLILRPVVLPKAKFWSARKQARTCRQMLWLTGRGRIQTCLPQFMAKLQRLMCLTRAQVQVLFKPLESIRAQGLALPASFWQVRLQAQVQMRKIVHFAMAC